MVSLYTSKSNNVITEAQESFDRVTLELYQSFMEGYVRRINEATFKVEIGGIRIGQAKYSRLAQINLKTHVLTFSKYAIENVPERGRRYLVLHELAHVKESTHNKRFWELVGRFEPDYRQVGRNLEIAFKRNVDNEETDKKAKRASSPVQGSPEQLKLFLGSLQSNYKVASSERKQVEELGSPEDDSLAALESADCLDEDLGE
jgi:hypothetical protein